MLKRMAFVLAFVLACGMAQAATVYLKNGSSVSGKIIARTADSVKLDVSGVTLTYYSDEINRVDETDAAAPAPAETAAPAKAVEPAPPAEVTSPPAAQNPSPVEAAPAAPQAPKDQPPAVAPAAPAEPAPQVVPPAPAASAEPTVQAEPPALSRPDPYAGMLKKDLILKFIDVFGTKKSMYANFAQMMNTLPPAQAEVFQKTFKVEEIIQELVPLYDKHFTEADLKALIDFYTTPIGQKLVTTIPQLMNESVEVSSKYFEAHMSQLTGDLKKNGATSVPSPKP